MKTKFAVALSALTILPLVAAGSAEAQTNGTYHGKSTRYHCKKSSGTTGTVAGAVGGGLVGSAVGGGTVGTLVGAGGGALLGRHLDKKHDAAQNRKNGC